MTSTSVIDRPAEPLERRVEGAPGRQRHGDAAAGSPRSAYQARAPARARVEVGRGVAQRQHRVGPGAEAVVGPQQPAVGATRSRPACQPAAAIVSRARMSRVDGLDQPGVGDLGQLDRGRRRPRLRISAPAARPAPRARRSTSPKPPAHGAPDHNPPPHPGLLQHERHTRAGQLPS